MSSGEDLREEAKRRLLEIEQACDQLSEDEFDRLVEATHKSQSDFASVDEMIKSIRNRKGEK